MKTEIEKRIFRLELMMYFVVAKLGVDTIGDVTPLLTTLWRTIW